MRPYRNSWIPGRATPDYDPGLPGMTFRIVLRTLVTGHWNYFEIRIHCYGQCKKRNDEAFGSGWC